MRRQNRFAIWVCCLAFCLMAGTIAAVALLAEESSSEPKLARMKRTVEIVARDRDGKREMKLTMPLEETLPILKAALSSGDSRFRYQVMSNGLVKFKDTASEDDVLTFLKDLFSTLGPFDRINVVFTLFQIDHCSQATKEVLRQAAVTQGKSREEVLLKNIGTDFLGYLDSGDESLLKKYNISASDLEATTAK